MKLIDADKLKENIAKIYTAQRRTKKDWTEEALQAMNMVDEQDEVLLSCPKCHGAKEYIIPMIDRRDWDIADECEEPHKCLICKGTGKVTIKAYEEYQERCRE